MSSIHNQDEKAFKKLFESYYNSLCNYAVVLVAERSLAEDLVQNLFLELWDNKKFKHLQYPERYLIRATKFKCLSYLRDTKEQISIEGIQNEDLSELPPGELKEQDIDALLHFFAASLPPKTQQVFLLSRSKQYSHQEIANTLNISVKTVENQMSRALKKMRELLKKLGYFIFLQIF